MTRSAVVLRSSSAKIRIADACAQNAVIVDVKGTRLTVKGGSVTISAPEVTVEGNLTVTGSLSY